ncbi:hemagglutinin repeat-containing protein, partial [Dyella choica]
SVGSTLSGDTVTVAAGHDLTGTAVQIAGTHDVTLAAGNNLTLNAGKDTYTETQSNGTSHTGLMNGGGFSVLIGNKSQTTTSTDKEVSYTGSLVGSTDGAVTLTAGNNVHITGSDVLSQTATNIVGKNVTIDAAVGSQDVTQTHKESSAGISLGLSGGVAATAQTLAADVHGASSSNSDSRLKALYAMQAAETLFSPGAGKAMGVNGTGYGALKNTPEALQQGYAHGAADTNGAMGGGMAGGVQGAGQATGISLHIGIGGGSSTSTGKTHDDVAYGSQISSNGNVTIAATGGDINVVGSQIKGNNVALSATNNINLLSQAEQHTQSNDSHNASGEVGLSIGQTTGIYLSVAAGESIAHGNGTTHTDSAVSAKDTLTMISGNDTTIKGAQATGNSVLANIGGNLNVASEQDTNDYASHSIQGGLTLVYGWGSSGGVGVSGNLAASKANSNYASVTQMSGIGAGNGGFDITVGGNTDLKGAAIASSADPSKNLLNTGSLSFSDIQNHEKSSAESISVGGGMGTGGLSGMTSFSPGIGIPQNSNKSSTTQAGIAEGSIVTRDNPTQDLTGLNRNVSLSDANGLTNTFDPNKIAQNQQAGMLAGQIGMTTAGDIARYMANHATTDAEKQAWSDGGANKVVLHGLVGAATAALGGGDALQGALGAMASEKASAAMQQYLDDQHITDPAQRNTLMQLASVAIGGAVGGGAGASTALAGDQYNRQLHATEQQLAQALAAKSNGLYTTQQIEDAMRLSGYSLGEGSVMPGETAQEGTFVNVKDSGAIYDTHASWVLLNGPGDSLYLQQVVPPQVNPDLAAYIVANTGGTNSPYAWAPEQRGMSQGAAQYQALSDWYTGNHIGTRALGAAQFVGGELEAVGGLATAMTCETGLGCAVSAYLTGAGLDNAAAGYNAAQTGHPTATLGQQGGQALGLSPDAAALVYGATQLAPVGIEAYTANAAVKAQVAANAAARATYTLGGDLGDVQASLTQQVGNLRAALTGDARTSGNVGVAQINIPGVSPMMAASSQIQTPSAVEQALGFVGVVPETFPSTVVPTATGFPLLRTGDSEAVILNNVAAQLGDNTSIAGTIDLLTERPPCDSCSNIIQMFQSKYPNIKINILNNGGVIKPTPKVN